MQSMVKEFQEITGKYRKRYQRGKGEKLVGIRSLESNFNPCKQTYNPHYHLIVANAKMAYILLGEWLNRGKLKWIDPAGQDIRKVTNNVSALMEVIKYGSKIFTEPDVNKKTKSKGQSKIYVSALDNIFSAMKDLRIIERFGFNLLKEQEPANSQSAIVKEYGEWIYDSKNFDWLNIENGHCLTDYNPGQDLLNLMEKNIDIELK